MDWKEYISSVREYQAKGFDVYIYGAGKVGVRLLEELATAKLHPTAFLVTDSRSNLKTKSGVPVLQYDDITVDKGRSLVLVALKKPWNEDVLDLLEKESFPHVLDMQDDFDVFVKKPMILEITSRIGCKIACRFCPQNLLCANYKDAEMVLSLASFQQAVDKCPSELGIAFSGFAEPFLNPDMVKMIRYAHECGREIYLNTTLVCMTQEMFEKIKDIPFKQNILHLPDKDGFAHIPVTEEYLKLLDIVLEAKKVGTEEPFFDKANAQGMLAPDVEAIVANRIKVSNQLVDRAGNLPENPALKTASYLHGKIYCNCAPEMNAHVLLPNGDLALCCMDFGLQYTIGNLLKESYESIQNGEKMQEILALMDESPRGGCSLSKVHRGHAA